MPGGVRVSRRESALSCMGAGHFGEHDDDLVFQEVASGTHQVILQVGFPAQFQVDVGGGAGTGELPGAFADLELGLPGVRERALRNVLASCKMPC